MAVLPMTIAGIHGHATPNGYAKESTGNKQILGCFVALTAASATYAQADNANAAAVGAAIAASRRDGKTVTLMQACMAAPGYKAAGTVIGAKTVAISTDDITMELTTGDCSTEHANAAADVAQPLVLFVLYKI